MSAKKSDDDNSFKFDPLEALADVVLGDAFTFFDKPAKAVEKATESTNGDDARAGSKTSGESERGGGGRQDRESRSAESKSTIKPLDPPTKKGEAGGKQESSEGGKSDGTGKDGDSKSSAT